MIPGELKKQVVDAVHFGHSGPTKMLVKSNTFWWSGLRKDIEHNCSIFKACMSSSMNIKYQLRMTEEINQQVLTEPGQEIQIDFSGKLHNKRVTGEPYISIGSDRSSKWPVVLMCMRRKKSLNFWRVSKVLMESRKK